MTAIGQKRKFGAEIAPP